MIINEKYRVEHNKAGGFNETEFKMKIYCCQCKNDVNARLTSGAEIYPHRSDLSNLPFWRCDGCGNYVGCHYKTKKRTKPLGVIPSKEIMKYRKRIHSTLDCIWKSNRLTRTTVYEMMSKMAGYEFHTAQIRTVKEAENIYKKALNLNKLAFGRQT